MQENAYCTNGTFLPSIVIFAKLKIFLRSLESFLPVSPACFVFGARSFFISDVVLLTLAPTPAAPPPLVFGLLAFAPVLSSGGLLPSAFLLDGP